LPVGAALPFVGAVPFVGRDGPFVSEALASGSFAAAA
jgi:hypothetical protein